MVLYSEAIRPVTTVTRMSVDSGEQQSLFVSGRLPDAVPAKTPEVPATQEKPVSVEIPAVTPVPKPEEPLPAPKKSLELNEALPAQPIDPSRVRVRDIDGNVKHIVPEFRSESAPKPEIHMAKPEVRQRPLPVAPVTRPEAPVRPAQAEKTEQPKPALPHYRIVGTLFQTYIVLEFQDSILLIDQHAAHERIRFEQYKKLLDSHNAAQQLLAPIVLTLSPRELAAIETNRELLYECGYEIEPFGERDIRVLSVPHILGRADTRMIFMEIIDHLEQLRTVARDTRMAEIIQMSCKHAVKAGDTLSAAEIDALIARMLETGAPPTCPQGRPVLHKQTRRDLEHMFKRIQ